MRTRLTALLAALALAVPLAAQEPQTGNRTPALPANVRLELAITDTYTAKPTTKTVMMLIQGGQSGRVRTSNNVGGYNVQLNVDAVVRQMSATDISLGLTFEYTPSPEELGTAGARPAQLNESLMVTLQSGQKLLVSQSADPATDRRVTVEVTATILR